MKRVTPPIALGALMMLFWTSYGLAGAGAPVPPVSESSPPAGRPGGILDDATCEAIWNKVAKDDDGQLSAEMAGPFVTNFHAVDTNSDHKVSLEEFKMGCKNGWIEEGSGSPLPTNESSPEVPKE